MLVITLLPSGFRVLVGQPLLIVFLGSGSLKGTSPIGDGSFFGIEIALLRYYKLFYFIFFRYVLREGVRRAPRKRTGDARPRRFVFECDVCSNRPIQYGFFYNPISLCCESRLYFLFCSVLLWRGRMPPGHLSTYDESQAGPAAQRHVAHIVLFEHSSF